MPDYLILSKTSSLELQEYVNYYIIKGYKPLGGVSIDSSNNCTCNNNSNGNGITYYIQAIINDDIDHIPIRFDK